MLEEESLTGFGDHGILYSQGEVDGRGWGQEIFCSLLFCQSRSAATAAGGPWGQKKDQQPSGAFIL